ncbi:outer dense fiber protein 2 [Sphaerodactylus townsendi]|nr:outer dense fiber protein 2 [Sphaerodactylus townsendi]
MGERRAASWRRSRKSICGSWTCSCPSNGSCCCGFSAPRWPVPRPQGLHGSRSQCSYRRLIDNFEEVLRRRLRGRFSSAWLSPSLKNGVIVSTQRKLPPATEARLLSQKHKQKMKGDTVNVRRSVRVKTKVPWMPPGKTSIKESSYKWEGPTHRLEITPPDSDKLLSVLRLSDLSTEEEDTIHSKMNKYEKKIDSLMNVVGTLKNEVKVPKQEESRCVAKRLLEEQKEELDEVTQELVDSEHENAILRRNIERMKEEKDLSVLQKRHLQHEKECLMTKLVETEMDGAAAAKQIQALKDSINKLKTEKQVLKTRMEADEVTVKLELCDKENKTLKEEMSKEIENARKEFQSQIAELEKLPEILRITETKLAECQDQLKSYEKKNSDLTAMIGDLRQRIELQGDKMEMTREKYQSAQEENKHLIFKLEELERKLEATSAQNIEFLQIIAKREESIHQSQLRLEEKTRECGSLARQLEMAIDDSRRQLEQTKDRAASRERAAQSKMLDLETQLSRTKTELNQLRRGKDDAEHRYESRLQDLKDRLEQSESTNRSMQNYVQFLKSSYANVFGDSALTSSPIRPRSPF